METQWIRSHNKKAAVELYLFSFGAQPIFTNVAAKTPTHLIPQTPHGLSWVLCLGCLVVQIKVSTS
jgi:hypothetical protein